MKSKIFNSSILISLLILSFGCQESFLEKPPLNNLTENNFWKTSEDAISSITACYDGLQMDGAYRWGYLLNGDVRSEDAGCYDSGWYMQHDNFSISSSDGQVLRCWRSFYTTIFRCNSAIANIPNITMDKNLQLRLINEAHFLRAVAYFNIVTIWGQAPLKLNPSIGSEELKIKSAQPEEIWAQIEKDLIQAENLPNKGETNSGELGRATKGAAKAFLAKAYLYQKKWQLAADKAKEIMELGIYSLNAKYGDNWNRDKENGIESVFEMQYSGVIDGWMTHEGNILGSWLAPGGANRYYPDGGWSIIVPEAPHLSAYEPNDLRRKINLFVNGDVYEGAKDGPQAYDSNWSRTGMNIAKYLVVNNYDATESMANGHLNIPVIRYTDVLLMRAEALNELGQTSAAEPLLNTVRSRAGLPKVVGLSKDLFRTKILAERRVEFYAEGSYFFDELRMLTKSQLSQRMQAAGKTSFNYDRDKYYPIPQNDIDLNPGLTQNSGY